MIGNAARRSFKVLAGWIIDGSGGPVRQRVRLEIAEGIFRRIEDAQPPFSAVREPAQASVVDFHDCTVLPGLIDSHVHLAMAGSMDENLRTRLRQAPAEVVFQMIQENLREHLRCGVVAVRDGGGARGSTLQFAKGPQRRGAPSVRVFASGRAWHRHGRYGRFIGRPVDGSDLGPSILRDESPCDLVKIVNSGVNSLTEFGRQTAVQFSLEELTAAVQAARQKGLPVMAHANGEEAVRIAIFAGCGSVEHAFFMGMENLERMAEKGTVWVPTVAPMQAYARQLAPSDRRSLVVRRTVDHQLEQLQRARRLNVTVALGTDAGSPGVNHGAAVIHEMQLLMAAGYSLAEAVRCASFNGAGLIGEDFGLLAQGRPATFVVVPGGPSGLPGSLNHARAVYVAGERVVEAG
jgi:imidazolonepropionase-like amidohydrolase